jgi:hypothetical protein
MRIESTDSAYPEILAASSAADSLRIVMRNSMGQPVMSDKDVKLALVETMIALDWQCQLNEKLVNRIQELEKKSRNPFRK